MVERGMFILTVAAAIGSGLIAGVFFAFSSFVMSGLGRLPADHGIAAMQSINITVLNFTFLGTFIGTAILCALLAAASWFWWGQPNAILIMLASLIYIVGCFGVTIVCNVPMNNVLAAVQSNAPDAADTWSRYLRVWTNWNHVRTLAALVSAVLYVMTII